MTENASNTNMTTPPSSSSTTPTKRQRPSSPSPSTSPVQEKLSKLAEGGVVRQEVQFSEELLQFYYKRLFPYREMFDWLCYGHDPSSKSRHVDKTFFSRREFSFTLDGDVYVRYRSFRDKDDFQAAIQRRWPIKIDIGGVYSVPPSQHDSVPNFVPVEKELVFDIDMTDYDPVRTCCNEASICALCWPLMSAAMHVVDDALRLAFGFKHLLWIYSGRRGVHCWVCDESARQLDDDDRAKMVSFLHVELGSDENQSVDVRWPPYPYIQKAYETLEPYFQQITLKNQEFLDHEDQWEEILKLVPDSETREALAARWRSKRESPKKRWKQLCKTTRNQAKAARDSRNYDLADALDSCRYKIVFRYVYPRLDINVSKARNHLLKSPFCAHPKTGRVCVPISPQGFDSFDPQAVPTLEVLRQEVDAVMLGQHDDDDDDNADDADTTSPGGKPTRRTRKQTSLQDYVDTFKEFLNPLLQEIREKRRAVEEESLSF